jgi:hypothetical protein
LNTNSEVLHVNRTLHNGDILYITAHSVMNFTELDHCEVLRINSSFDLKSQSVSNLERLLIKSRHHRLTNPSGGYPHLSTPCYSLISVMYATVKWPWSTSAIFQLDRSNMEPWEKKRRILVLQPNSSQSSHDCSWEPTLGCRLLGVRQIVTISNPSHFATSIMSTYNSWYVFGRSWFHIWTRRLSSFTWFSSIHRDKFVYSILK